MTTQPASATLMPLSTDLDECLAHADTLTERITAALLEVGGKRKYGVWLASDRHFARAQQLALDSLGIDYTLVPLADYAAHFVARFPTGRPLSGHYGLGCRDSWWISPPTPTATT